ncbi:hypothetical protein APSETT445_007417 [Aspergillus pseudonomiae]
MDAAESTAQPDPYAATPEDRKFFWALGSEPYLSATSLVSHVAAHTDEDFNRDHFTRATGFIGKSSEISWLQMLSKYVDSGCEVCHPVSGISSPALTSYCDGPIASSNYHLDDFDMPTIERLDTFELPSKDTATKLFNAYLSSVHPSFPIIGISTFASQFQAFFNNPSLKPGNKWLAILNLIFAIGARYAHLTNAEWRRDRDDHYSYFIRARNMSLEGQLLHHSDLQQLQVEGLASFYMLSSGHMNRTKIGITKPCLRRIESSALGDKSEEFCRKAAAECVESACHLLRLFPEPLEAALLHKLSPWWCILHFLMQATAILLIELSFHVQHVPEKAAMVSKAVKKSYDWLSVMSETSMASEKARRMCDEFLRRLGFNDGTEIHSFPCIAGLTSQNSPDDELHDPRHRSTRVATPNGIPSREGSMPLSPVDHSSAAFARPSSVGLEVPETHEFEQDEKIFAVHNLYDSYLPYDPNTGQITGSFFPSEDDIDIRLGPYNWDETME